MFSLPWIHFCCIKALKCLGCSRLLMFFFCSIKWLYCNTRPQPFDPRVCIKQILYICSMMGAIGNPEEFDTIIGLQWLINGTQKQDEHICIGREQTGQRHSKFLRCQGTNSEQKESRRILGRELQ